MAESVSGDSGPATRSGPAPVRAGHWASLERLGSPDFGPIRKRFESEDDLGGVYFRVTDKGLQPVALDPTVPKPYAGVGGVIRRSSGLGDLEDGMADRLANWQKKGERPGALAERRLHCRLVQEALRSGLRLGTTDGLGLAGSHLRFIASEWRLARDTKPSLIDIVAVDVERRCLVLIELKPAADAAARAQVLQYRAIVLEQSSELLPFFEALARVMGAIYGCDELADIHLDRATVAALVVWPAGGAIEVQAVEGDPPTDLPNLVGPQYSGDEPWRARMRRHQSWWRSVDLGVECGTGPTPASTNELGSMITAQDGLAGLNFLTPSIHAVAEERMASGGGVEPFRCRCNLLSSQPMAFNLFGPLAADPALATRLMGSLLPGQVADVSRVEIEWAPRPKGEYLNDGTSFDVLIEGTASDGGRLAIGIECKLTEPFSAKVNDPSKYLPLTQAHPDVWDSTTVKRLPDIRWMQLWRNHLLAQALIDHPESRFDSYVSLVVGHPEDPSLGAVVEGYRALLTETGRSLVQLRTIDKIVEAWRPSITDDSDLVRWLDRFSRRYLELELSDAEPPNGEAAR